MFAYTRLEKTSKNMKSEIRKTTSNTLHTAHTLFFVILLLKKFHLHICWYFCLKCYLLTKSMTITLSLRYTNLQNIIMCIKELWLHMFVIYNHNFEIRAYNMLMRKQGKRSEVQGKKNLSDQLWSFSSISIISRGQNGRKSKRLGVSGVVKKRKSQQTTRQLGISVRVTGNWDKRPIPKTRQREKTKQKTFDISIQYWYWISELTE